MADDKQPAPENAPNLDPWSFVWDISRIPCWREACLYGLGSATAMSMHRLYKTRSNRQAFHAFMLTGMAVSGVSWYICRKQFKNQRDNVKMMMELQSGTHEKRPWPMKDGSKSGDTVELAQDLMKESQDSFEKDYARASKDGTN